MLLHRHQISVMQQEIRIHRQDQNHSHSYCCIAENNYTQSWPILCTLASGLCVQQRCILENCSSVGIFLIIYFIFFIFSGRRSRLSCSWCSQREIVLRRDGSALGVPCAPSLQLHIPQWYNVYHRVLSSGLSAEILFVCITLGIGKIHCVSDKE